MNFNQIALQTMNDNEAAEKLLELFFEPVATAVLAIPLGLVSVDPQHPKGDELGREFANAVAALRLDTMRDARTGSAVGDLIADKGRELWDEGRIGAQLESIDLAISTVEDEEISLSIRDTMLLFAASKLRNAYGAVFGGC